MGKDYYKTLQLTSSARDNEIKSAYRRLALRYHPLKAGNDQNTIEKFDNLAEAYDVLTDPINRAIYDQYGYEGLTKGVPLGKDGEWSDGYVFHGDAERTFRDFFGGDNPFTEFFTTAEENQRLGFGGIDGRSRKKKDPPIIRDLVLSIDDCYHGAIKKVKINRRVINDDGITSSIREKILSITIKRGWLPGTKVIFEDEGDQGPNNIPADLIFIIKDKPHAYFRRENSNLIYTAKINLGQALIGTTVHIEHLDGRKLDVPINEIVKPGYRKCIPNQGMPLMKDPEKYGDLIIEFDVEYPQKLNRDQKLYIKEALISSTVRKQHSQHQKANMTDKN